jgi:hypothetical protein
VGRFESVLHPVNLVPVDNIGDRLLHILACLGFLLFCPWSQFPPSHVEQNEQCTPNLMRSSISMLRLACTTRPSSCTWAPRPSRRAAESRSQKLPIAPRWLRRACTSVAEPPPRDSLKSAERGSQSNQPQPLPAGGQNTGGDVRGMGSTQAMNKQQ